MNSFLIVAAMFMTTPLEDGTLIYIEHGRRIVELGTDSIITHVAIIATDKDGVNWIYEAAPPRVRRISLSAYYKEITAINEKRTEKERKHMRMWIMKPKVKFSSTQAKRLSVFLESQVGKRYSILSYLIKHPVKRGCHCAELVSHAFKRLGIIFGEKPCEENPQSVVKQVAKYYKRPVEVCLPANQEVLVTAD